MCGSGLLPLLEPKGADTAGPDPRALCWEKRLCGAAITGALAVAAALFRYVHPLADDFARGYKGRATGVLPSVVDEYFNWTGRWASSSSSYLLTSSFDLVRLYPLLAMIAPALLAAAVPVLLRAAGVGTTGRQRLALAAGALAISWAGMPHPGETVYWLTGGVDYLTGLALSLLLLAGLLREQSARLPVVEGAGLCLLAVLATGFHEIVGLVLCLALAGGTLRAGLARDPRRGRWMACLAAALAGFLAVAAAPGNAVRRAAFPLAGDLGVAALLTVKQGFEVVPWILDLRLLTGTALLLLLAPEALAGRQPRTRAWDVWIAALTWLAAVGAAFAAASWAIGAPMPGRMLAGIYLVFLAGWFWVLVMLAQRCAGRREPLLTATPPMRRVAVALFATSLLLTGNTWRALLDLRSDAPAFGAAMRDRWRTLATARARGAGDAVVARLPARPRSYAGFELHEDPAYWENWGVAHYFGLRSVRLAGQGPAPASRPQGRPGSAGAPHMR